MSIPKENFIACASLWDQTKMQYIGMIVRIENATFSHFSFIAEASRAGVANPVPAGTESLAVTISVACRPVLKMERSSFRSVLLKW